MICLVIVTFYCFKFMRKSYHVSNNKYCHLLCLYCKLLRESTTVSALKYMIFHVFMSCIQFIPCIFASLSSNWFFIGKQNFILIWNIFIQLKLKISILSLLFPLKKKKCKICKPQHQNWSVTLSCHVIIVFDDVATNLSNVFIAFNWNGCKC